MLRPFAASSISRKLSLRWPELVAYCARCMEAWRAMATDIICDISSSKACMCSGLRESKSAASMMEGICDHSLKRKSSQTATLRHRHGSTKPPLPTCASHCIIKFLLLREVGDWPVSWRKGVNGIAFDIPSARESLLAPPEPLEPMLPCRVV
jgi:hypothetical protein